jgi:hypothetical protein
MRQHRRLYVTEASGPRGSGMNLRNWICRWSMGSRMLTWRTARSDGSADSPGSLDDFVVPDSQADESLSPEPGYRRYRRSKVGRRVVCSREGSVRRDRRETSSSPAVPTLAFPSASPSPRVRKQYPADLAVRMQRVEQAVSAVQVFVQRMGYRIEQVLGEMRTLDRELALSPSALQSWSPSYQRPLLPSLDSLPATPRLVNRAVRSKHVVDSSCSSTASTEVMQR